MKDAFYKIFDKYQYHAVRATDFYLKSLNFKRHSLEWQICRLQAEREHELARPYIKQMADYAEYWVRETHGQI